MSSLKKLRTYILPLAAVGALALAAVNYLSHYPILISANNDVVYGQPFLKRAGENIALIVDTTAIRLSGQSGKFSQVDWSYGWMNLLLQEAKRYDLLDISQLPADPTKLEAYHTIIVTGSATGSALGQETVASTDYWKRWSETDDGENTVGRTLYLEFHEPAPMETMLAEYSWTAETNHQNFLSLSSVDQTFHAETQGFGLTFESSEDIVHLFMDDQVALIETRIGHLRTLVASFDFGRLAVTIQQGKPNDDFSITPTITKKTGLLPIVTGDLCADSSYYSLLTPFFDLFERELYQIIMGTADAAPEPLFAEAPHGAFIMSHDEEGMGDRSPWMAEAENNWGLTSSYSVSPANITARGLEEIHAAGAEIAVHFDRYSYFQRPGLPGLRPFRVEIPLIEQRRSLEEKLPALKPILVNRNHWLQWSGHYTQTFREMAGAGIQLDLSYGPLGEGLVGYIFGTCFPFTPLDTNGFPLPILELPFLLQDDELFSPAYLDSLFNRESFNEEFVSFIFHVNTMAHTPDTLTLWGWRESFSRAKTAQMPIIQYRDILNRLKEIRATVPLESENPQGNR